MEKIFCIVTAVLIILTFPSQGKTTVLGNLESFRESEKQLSFCFDDLMRKLQSIDATCNHISDKTSKLETGVAAVKALTDSLEGDTVYFDHTLKNQKNLVTTVKNENNKFKTRAAALEGRNTKTKDELQDFASRAITLETFMVNVQGLTTRLVSQIAEYQMFFDHVKVDPDDINGLRGPHMIFTGANIHVRRGTSLSDITSNSSGNLIVGYNENTFGTPRTGSHNVVVGAEHAYCSDGGFVAGLSNMISGAYASVSGGMENVASGYASSIRGGRWMETVEHYSYAPESDQTAGSH